LRNQKKLRLKKEIDGETLAQRIVAGDKVALSRGITLIESYRPKDSLVSEKLIAHCLKANANSIRIGITGVPGVGKSTFIEAFGSYLTKIGKKVAVLAVDPSSSISKGSILGDKTRMENLSKDPNAFIRPSPAQDTLGGVARHTRETIILCEAAGFDVILVETVGVGQSETLVHSMVDFFLLLKLSGAGDELQGMKRGIMEMADLLVINKADGDNIKAVKHAASEFKRALHLYPPKDNSWTTKVTTCSSLNNIGIDLIWDITTEFITITKSNGHFKKNRATQDKNWFLQTVGEQLKHRFFNHEGVQQQMEELILQIEGRQISPIAAAQALLSKENFD